ncbi:MAG: hypothetical protein HN584_07310, partial [Akkermansiaceae bacterium]|nr:hypothetical protein [Akkermansiaceae bacterium]
MEAFLILTGLILAINALVKANQALKENTELRSKLNELLYDKSSQEQKNKELKEQTKSTANKDTAKTVQIPVPPVTSDQPKTSDVKELDEKAIDLKIWIDGNTHNANEPIKVRLFAKDKDGVGIWSKGNLTLLKLSDTTLLPVEVISSWPIELNPLEESTQRLDFNAPEPGSYRLKFTLNDPDLSTIHEFTVAESSVKSAQESSPISPDSKTLKAATETPKSSFIVHTAKEKVRGPDKRIAERATHSSPAKVEPAKEKDSDSIEMKLGTYWFVRIGVVLL